MVTRPLQLLGRTRTFGDFRSAVRWYSIKKGHGSTVETLRVRGLKFPVYVRPRTSDMNVFRDTFWSAYHVPDFEPRTILDLGSNIGLTILDYHRRFPNARILGIELDSDNFNIARLNTQPYAECDVIHGAVWSEDGEVSYGGDEAWGFRVGEGRRKAKAYNIDFLIQKIGDVDFLKMDIEGAEESVLSHNTSWAARVKAMKIETHSPYTIERCCADVTRLGFRAIRDSKHHGCVMATR